MLYLDSVSEEPDVVVACLDTDVTAGQALETVGSYNKDTNNHGLAHRSTPIYRFGRQMFPKRIRFKRPWPISTASTLAQPLSIRLNLH